jgi:hypothetical protein
MSLMHAHRDSVDDTPPIDRDAPADFQTATFSLG